MKPAKTLANPLAAPGPGGTMTAMKCLLLPISLALVVVGCQPGDQPTSQPTPPSTEGAKEVPANARVFFKSPQSGAKLKSPVKFEFGVENMDLVPAGTRPGDKSAGHHHLILNGGPFPVGEVIPMDDGKHYHYGKAQDKAELELKPGKYTVTMQFADAVHASYGPKLAATIEIEVVE